MEIPKSLMNAGANVLGYKNDGGIRFLRRFGRIVGIWVRSFPGNTTQSEFLAMFCAMEKKEKQHRKVLEGAYSISKSASGNGYDVLFK